MYSYFPHGKYVLVLNRDVKQTVFKCHNCMYSFSQEANADLRLKSSFSLRQRRNK